MTVTQDWDDMITEFRALGGVADNVRLDRGALGRGLFPVDPGKPAKIMLPENLLFPADELEFVDGDLRVKKKGETPTREARFFDAYQKAFSWGAGGRADCEAFFESMAALPEAVREVLIKDWRLGSIILGTGAEAVQTRFLRTRMISHNNRDVLMPVLELANHGAKGTPFNFSDGISISGTYAGEVLARYNSSDPLGVFLAWGFPSPEPVAYSLAMKLPLGKRTLLVGRELTKNKEHGRMRIPEITVADDKIQLSHLMLGHARAPRLARGVFQHFARRHEIAAPDEVFDRIRQLNGIRFLNLLSVLEDCEGPTVSALRKMVRYQIASLMFCVGTREL